MAQVAPASFPSEFRRHERRQLVLRNHQSPGDVLMLTAAVRDLHLCYPGLFKTDVTGLKELVRFGMRFKAGAVGQGAEFRILPPTWYDKAV